jgi:hypothetical protein
MTALDRPGTARVSGSTATRLPQLEYATKNNHEEIGQ